MKRALKFLPPAALVVGLAVSLAPAGALAKSKHGASGPKHDRASYGHSGTRGRMGLGASPRAPEGPGNPSTR